MDQELKELVERLKSTYGQRLISVILYGSAASGDQDAAFSDVNVMCVLDRVDAKSLAQSESIFKWLRDPKYRPASGTGPEEVGLRFLPVEIVKEVLAARPMPVAENHIEIELAGGHLMRISGSYDPEALARLIRGLSV